MSFGTRTAGFGLKQHFQDSTNVLTPQRKKKTWTKLKGRIHKFTILTKQCSFADVSFLWESLQSSLSMGGDTVQSHIHPIPSTWMLPFFSLTREHLNCKREQCYKSFLSFLSVSRVPLQNTALSDLVSIRHICPISAFTSICYCRTNL